MSSLKTIDPIALSLLMTDDLYSVDEQVQVIEPSPVIDNPSQEAVFFNYNGENNKYILIAVNELKYEVINPTDLVTLTTILTAKNLEVRDVAIVNLHKYPNTTFKQLKEFFSLSKLVLLGINPAHLGLPEISSNLISIYDNSKILATYSFAEMQDDVAKKRVFWNEMKKL